MNAKQVSSRSTVKKTGTKSVFINGKHKKHGNVYVCLCIRTLNAILISFYNIFCLLSLLK